MTYGSGPYGSTPYGADDDNVIAGGLPDDPLLSGAWAGAPWAAFAWAGTPDVVVPSAGAQESIGFLHGLAIAGATLTTVQPAAVSVDNLLDMQPSVKWRSTARYDSILITLARHAVVNAVALRHDLGPCGMWRLRHPGADTGWTSVWPLGVKPNVDDWGQFVSLLRWTNTAPVRELRLDIADTSAGRTCVEASRLMVGWLWQPPLTMDWDSPIGRRSKDVQIDGAWLPLFSERRGSRRLFKPKFSTMNRAAAQEYGMDLERRLGLARDVMCFLDPGAAGDFHLFAVHGLLMAMNDWQPQPLWDGESWTWSVGLQIEELG